MKSFRTLLRLFAVLTVVLIFQATFPSSSAKACVVGVWGGNVGCYACACLYPMNAGYLNCTPDPECSTSPGQAHACQASGYCDNENCSPPYCDPFGGGTF